MKECMLSLLLASIDRCTLRRSEQFFCLWYCVKLLADTVETCCLHLRDWSNWVQVDTISGVHRKFV
jgi:hypothetical protein